MNNQSSSNSLLDNIKQTITSKWIGFYLGVSSIVIGIIVAIIYQVHYTGTAYYSSVAVILPFIAALLFIGLSLFKETSKFAPIISSILIFIAFLIFINASYMYLSEVFYSGISKETLQALDKTYVVCIVLFLISGIVGNVAIYKKQNKEKLKGEENHE